MATLSSVILDRHTKSNKTVNVKNPDWAARPVGLHRDDFIIPTKETLMREAS